MNEKQFKAAMGNIVRENTKRLIKEEQEKTNLLECARCGEMVNPDEHPPIGCDI